jgi:thiol:disulfide interchange protein DsbA
MFMRNKMFLGFYAVVALAALIAYFSFDPLEKGVNYVVLEKSILNAQNTLIEIFSYDCDYCFIYEERALPTVVPDLPAGLIFRPFHLKTRGKYGIQGSELFAVLLVKDQESGLSDKDLFSEKSLFRKAKMAYYQAYHDKKERWDAGPEAFLKTGLDAAGLSREEFEAAKSSPKVKGLLDEWDVSYEIGKRQGGIPAFVVNGKYLIKTRTIKSVGLMQSIIKELSKKSSAPFLDNK